jgi:hypothetical protein
MQNLIQIKLENIAKEENKIKYIYKYQKLEAKRVGKLIKIYHVGLKKKSAIRWFFS